MLLTLTQIYIFWKRDTLICQGVFHTPWKSTEDVMVNEATIWGIQLIE